MGLFEVIWDYLAGLVGAILGNFGVSGLRLLHLPGATVVVVVMVVVVVVVMVVLVSWWRWGERLWERVNKWLGETC